MDDELCGRIGVVAGLLLFCCCWLNYCCWVFDGGGDFLLFVPPGEKKKKKKMDDIIFCWRIRYFSKELWKFWGLSGWVGVFGGFPVFWFLCFVFVSCFCFLLLVLVFFGFGFGFFWFLKPTFVAISVQQLVKSIIHTNNFKSVADPQKNLICSNVFTCDNYLLYI